MTSPKVSVLRFVLSSFFVACMVPAAFSQNVLTYHNNNARTGLNAAETTLTLSNVNSASFGKLFEVTVDGLVDGEPLYLSAVPIPGSGTHNLLIVVTENDSVYAFDADTGGGIWNISTLGAGETPSDDRGCSQVTPQDRDHVDACDPTANGIEWRDLYGGHVEKFFGRLFSAAARTGCDDWQGAVQRSSHDYGKISRHWRQQFRRECSVRSSAI